MAVARKMEDLVFMHPQGKNTRNDVLMMFLHCFVDYRGGLDLMELKKGTIVKTFIPKVAEGVFTVICMFTDNDEYVLYYHSGKKTLRVFRTNDAQMIANYKMQAELTAIKSTKDGQSLVFGTVDGCLSVFCIADPEKPEMQELLKQLPSRDINVR